MISYWPHTEARESQEYCIPIHRFTGNEICVLVLLSFWFFKTIPNPEQHPLLHLKLCILGITQNKHGFQLFENIQTTNYQFKLKFYCNGSFPVSWSTGVPSMGMH
jgi:hypothetical protein